MTTNHKLAECVYIMYILFQFSIATLSKSFCFFFILSKCIHIIVIPQKSFDIIFFARFPHFKCTHVVWQCIYIYIYPPAAVAYPCLVFESDICSFSLYIISLTALSFSRYFSSITFTLNIYSIFFFFFIALIVIIK